MAFVLLSQSFRSKEEFMKQYQRLSWVVVLGLAVAGLFASRMFAQEPSDRPKNETTMSGCLNKASSGNYTLTDDGCKDYRHRPGGSGKTFRQPQSDIDGNGEG